MMTSVHFDEAVYLMQFFFEYLPLKY